MVHAALIGIRVVEHTGDNRVCQFFNKDFQRGDAGFKSRDRNSSSDT